MLSTYVCCCSRWPVWLRVLANVVSLTVFAALTIIFVTYWSSPLLFVSWPLWCRLLFTIGLLIVWPASVMLPCFEFCNAIRLCVEALNRVSDDDDDDDDESHTDTDIEELVTS